MKILHLLLLALLVSGIQAEVSGQENQPSRIRRETIHVFDSASGFESTVILQSVPVKTSKNCYIHYTSLEKITGYSIRHYTEKGKWKLFRKTDIHDIQAIGDDFYSCDRFLAIELPEKAPFRVEYEISSSELILQSNLLFYNRLPVDTFYYELHIPANYHISTRLLYPEMLDYFRTDSVAGKNGTTFYYTAVPKNRDGISLRNDKSHIRDHRCMMLTAIVPEAFAGKETRYFNDWMLHKIQSKTILNEASRRVIDSIAGNSIDKDSITCALFNFIRDRIKYISVEVGYGAFVPHDVNKTLTSRQGDCKDMASLLCEALRSAGIDAWLALASTLTHPCDMTFPSLSAGNHMICVVKRNGSWLFLDPTNKSGTCWITAEGIQGRTILILNNEGGTYMLVPPVEPEKNLERIDMSLRIEGDSATGWLKYTAFGAAMQHLKAHYANTPKSEWATLSMDFLSEMQAGAAFSSPVITQATDSLTIMMKALLPPSVFIRNGKTAYLTLGFLPLPMEFLKGETSSGDILLGPTILRVSEVRIETGTTLTSVALKPVNYNQDGYSYNISAHPEGQVLVIRSMFRCDNISISSEKLAAYRKFNSFVSTSMNYAVAFK